MSLTKAKQNQKTLLGLGGGGGIEGAPTLYDEIITATTENNI